MRIGSYEHKELFCRSFIDTHEAYDPKDWPWPELEELSLARLRAIPIWRMALEAEVGAGTMLAGFGAKETDELVRHAIELQGYEEDRHGRILQCMIDRYALAVTPQLREKRPTRKAFVEFGYDECADSFAGFGIFRLAREARVLPEALTSLFTRLLREEARHIVFFVNWVAWDRNRRGLHGTAMQALPAVLSYAGAIARRAAMGKEMQNEEPAESPTGLFDEALANLTPASFLRACIEENERYMSDFDPRLLRPRMIPAIGRFALHVAEAIDKARANGRKATAARPSSPSAN